MKITVAGCGDAFGSGGRLQSCFHLETAGSRLLIDCGATALIGMERVGLSPAAVDTVVISHLHGDHYSGLVWWLLRAVYVEQRTSPLLVAGPPGTGKRLHAAAEALFPGMMQREFPFLLRFHELELGRRDQVGPVWVTPFEAVHPSGAPSYSLRLEAEGRTVAYSGDTEWNDALLSCSRDADLFICECFGYDSTVRNHLEWRGLSARLSDIGASRVLLTHMGADMLAHAHEAREAGVELAEDGLVLEV